MKKPSNLIAIIGSATFIIRTTDLSGALRHSMGHFQLKLEALYFLFIWVLDQPILKFLV